MSLAVPLMVMLLTKAFVVGCISKLFAVTVPDSGKHSVIFFMMLSVWNDEQGRHNLSMIDTQRYNDQVHVQAYHCRSDCSLVLRTQSIFQVKNAKA